MDRKNFHDLKKYNFTIVYAPKGHIVRVFVSTAYLGECKCVILHNKKSVRYIKEEHYGRRREFLMLRFQVKLDGKSSSGNYTIRCKTKFVSAIEGTKVELVKEKNFQLRVAKGKKDFHFFTCIHIVVYCGLL